MVWKMPSAGGQVPRQTDAPASASAWAIAHPKPPSSATPATSARLPERSIFSVIRPETERARGAASSGARRSCMLRRVSERDRHRLPSDAFALDLTVDGRPRASGPADTTPELDHTVDASRPPTASRASVGALDHTATHDEGDQRRFVPGPVNRYTIGEELGRGAQ